LHLLLQHLCVLFIRRNLDTLSSRPAFANIEKDLAAQDFIVERYLKAKQPAQTEAVPRPLKASYEPVIGWDKEEPIKEMAKEDKSNDGKDERQPDTTPALDLTKPLQEPDLYSYTTTATLDDTTTTPAISHDILQDPSKNKLFSSDDDYSTVFNTFTTNPDTSTPPLAPSPPPPQRRSPSPTLNHPSAFQFGGMMIRPMIDEEEDEGEEEGESVDTSNKSVKRKHYQPKRGRSISSVNQGAMAKEAEAVDEDKVKRPSLFYVGGDELAKVVEGVCYDLSDHHGMGDPHTVLGLLINRPIVPRIEGMGVAGGVERRTLAGDIALTLDDKRFSDLQILVEDKHIAVHKVHLSVPLNSTSLTRSRTHAHSHAHIHIHTHTHSRSHTFPHTHTH